jgi:hypothetical protein
MTTYNVNDMQVSITPAQADRRCAITCGKPAMCGDDCIRIAVRQRVQDDIRRYDVKDNAKNGKKYAAAQNRACAVGREIIAIRRGEA